MILHVSFVERKEATLLTATNTFSAVFARIIEVESSLKTPFFDTIKSVLNHLWTLEIE